MDYGRYNFRGLEREGGKEGEGGKGKERERGKEGEGRRVTNANIY